MNCTQVKELLPAHVYGDVPAPERDALETHVRECLNCRQEWQELVRVSQMLDAPSCPEAQVDLAALYRRAGELERLRRLKLRRVVWVLAGIAAALLCALFLRVEVRWDDRQLIVGWGAPAEKPPREVVREVALSPTELLKDTQVIKELVHELAAWVALADADQREQIANLNLRLERFLAGAESRWTSTENDVRALYTAYFGQR